MSCWSLAFHLNCHSYPDEFGLLLVAWEEHGSLLGFPTVQLPLLSHSANHADRRISQLSTKASLPLPELEQRGTFSALFAACYLRFWHTFHSALLHPFSCSTAPPFTSPSNGGSGNGTTTRRATPASTPMRRTEKAAGGRTTAFAFAFAYDVVVENWKAESRFTFDMTLICSPLTQSRKRPTPNLEEQSIRKRIDSRLNTRFGGGSANLHSR